MQIKKYPKLISNIIEAYKNNDQILCEAITLMSNLLKMVPESKRDFDQKLTEQLEHAAYTTEGFSKET